MRRDDFCQLCKDELGDYYFSWSGPPFSTSKIIIVCQYCGNVVKSQVIDNVAISGTCDNDVYSLTEMIEDGFTDKKRIIKSIKTIGKHLELTTKEINERVKENDTNKKNKREYKR